MAARLRSHRSNKKFKLKKPKQNDIFFGQEIQQESQRMINEFEIEKIKQRESLYGTSGLFGTISQVQTTIYKEVHPSNNVLFMPQHVDSMQSESSRPVIPSKLSMVSNSV